MLRFRPAGVIQVAFALTCRQVGRSTSGRGRHARRESGGVPHKKRPTTLSIQACSNTETLSLSLSLRRPQLPEGGCLFVSNGASSAPARAILSHWKSETQDGFGPI